MGLDSTSKPEFETIVAGAGPAGIMAAIKAAEAGRVLLVDSSAFPRDKSCGGMIHEQARKGLDRIAKVPDELLLDPGHVNFRYWDWDRSIKKATALRFLNVNRIAFDDWMLSLLPSNVEVVGSTSLVGFSQTPKGVTVSLKSADSVEEVQCATLIGADGARSAVRRGLGVDNVSTYVTLQDFVTLDGAIEPFFDCIYMRDIGDDFAYAYVVPKGETAIIGSVFYPKTRRPHLKQDQCIEILRTKLPQLGESVKREASVALHVRSMADVVPGQGRVLLAGEAGGFMSPTSGEGISYAINSGYYAGQAVATSNPEDRLAEHTRLTSGIAGNIRRKFRWLPIMESRTGKYVAGFVPTPIVSKITEGL